MDAFNRMEDKAQKMLDEATAMAELNSEPIDKAKALEEKYASKSSFSVEEELNRMKRNRKVQQPILTLLKTAH